MNDWINYTTKKEQERLDFKKTVQSIKEFLCVTAIGAVIAVGFVYGLDKELDVYESNGQQIAAAINKLAD